MIRSSHIFFSRKSYWRPLKVFQSLPDEVKEKRVLYSGPGQNRKSLIIFLVNRRLP